MGPRRGFRAATEKCQGLTPQDQPFATNLAMASQLVSEEGQGAVHHMVPA